MKTRLIILTSFVIAVGLTVSVCSADEYWLEGPQPTAHQPAERPFRSPLARIRGWFFRRYAGSVEMDTKTEYPKTYWGTYTYRPWRPAWVSPMFGGTFHQFDAPAHAPAEDWYETPGDETFPPAPSAEPE